MRNLVKRYNSIDVIKRVFCLLRGEWVGGKRAKGGDYLGFFGLGLVWFFVCVVRRWWCFG